MKLSREQRGDDKIEALMKQIDQRVSKAISESLISTKSEFKAIKDDNRRFKNDLEKEVRKIKDDRRAALTSFIADEKKEIIKKLASAKQSLGASMSNFNRARVINIEDLKAECAGLWASLTSAKKTVFDDSLKIKELETVIRVSLFLSFVSLILSIIGIFK